MNSKATFWEISNIMSFRGNSLRLLVAKKLPALENHFHPETVGFQNVYFLLQLQLNLQNERDRSLLKTTSQAGCHKIAQVVGSCLHFGFRHCNQARDRVKSLFTCS